MSNIDGLRWVRIFTPSHIPSYLVEQIRDRDYSVESFYQYHEINCLCPSADNEFRLNPFSHLYILIDEKSSPKGLLWLSVDPLTKDLIIQTYSIDKQYWGKGLAVKKLAEHVRDIRRKAHLNKIYWITNYPKHSEKNGFKRSKSVLMEYNEHEEKNHGKNMDGGIDARGEHKSADTAAAELPLSGSQSPECTSCGTSV